MGQLYTLLGVTRSTGVRASWSRRGRSSWRPVLLGQTLVVRRLISRGNPTTSAAAMTDTGKEQFG